MAADGRVRLEDFNDPVEGHLERGPGPVMREIATTRAYARTMPVGPIEALLWPLAIVSLAVIAVAFARRETRPVALYGAVIVPGWLLNNAVCGALSTPHEGYQARMIWILSLIAALLAARWWQARTAETSASGAGAPHTRIGIST